MSRPETPATHLDAAEGTVRVVVEIAAPPERVFDALTDPAALAAWWRGLGDAQPASAWQVELRPGGRWQVRSTDADGAPAIVRGEYRVVDRPHVLETTWRASWDHFAPTSVRYELAPAVVSGVSGTRLTVTHTGFGATACASMHALGAIGWSGAVARLVYDARAFTVLARAA